MTRARVADLRAISMRLREVSRMKCWARVTCSRVANCSGDVPMTCLNTPIHDLDQHVVVTDRAAHELVWLGIYPSPRKSRSPWRGRAEMAAVSRQTRSTPRLTVSEPARDVCFIMCFPRSMRSLQLERNRYLSRADRRRKLRGIIDTTKLCIAV